MWIGNYSAVIRSVPNPLPFPSGGQPIQPSLLLWAAVWQYLGIVTSIPHVLDAWSSRGTLVGPHAWRPWTPVCAAGKFIIARFGNCVHNFISMPILGQWNFTDVGMHRSSSQTCLLCPWAWRDCVPQGHSLGKWSNTASWRLRRHLITPVGED